MAAPQYMHLYQGQFIRLYLHFLPKPIYRKPTSVSYRADSNLQQTLKSTSTDKYCLPSQFYLFKLAWIAMVTSCQQVSEHYRSITSNFLPRVRLSTISTSSFFKLKSLMYKSHKGDPVWLLHFQNEYEFQKIC